MAPPRNLVRGQYQVGDLVFGRGTNVRVQNFEVMPYDVQAQEMQASRAFEKRFGIDQLTPSTINITFGVMRNYVLPNAKTQLTDAIFRDFPKVGHIRREWRNPELLRKYGELAPLYVCGLVDGVTRIVWGRPGQFTYARPNKQTEWLECLGEWRCADTVAYNSTEMIVFCTLANGNANFIHGTGGDAETWIRAVFSGPMISPKLMVGSTEISLNYTIAANEIVEVSGYPQSRRIVSSKNGVLLNLSGVRSGNTPYLDKLFIENDAELPITLTAGGMTASSAAAVCWRDAYEIID